MQEPSLGCKEISSETTNQSIFVFLNNSLSELDDHYQKNVMTNDRVLSMHDINNHSMGYVFPERSSFIQG